MRKFLVPLTSYAMLGAMSFAFSGAPMRVHVLLLGALALALLFPSMLAAHLRSYSARWLVCIAFAIVAMVAWDVTAHYVVLNAEPFFILRTAPWAYAAGALFFVPLSFCVAWAGSPQALGVIVMTEDRTLRTSRTLPYSPKEIYGAFASPELLASWWGPEGFSNTFEIFEFTAGGRWKFVMHGPDGNHYSNESIFVTLVPDARVVIRHDCPPHFVLAVELTPVSDGTLLTWEQVFEDAQTAQAVKRRVGSANEQNIDRLTNVLSKAPNAA